MKNKRVFVSGGAGVIGRALIPMLVNAGAKVLVGDLECIPKDFPSSNVTYRHGDLNSLTQEEIDYFNPEIFIHLAATFERSEETYSHWEENFHHNVKLSHHLISILRNAPNLKRVVNASSYLIYDKSLYMFKSPQKKPYKLKESDPINPRNLTGMSKLSHEIELSFLSNFKSNDFSSVSARIYRGYGTNSRDIISRWIRSLLNDEEIIVYNEEGFFDYMFSIDTALGLLKLAESDFSGIIILGSGKSRRVKDVLNILLDYFPDMKYKKVIRDNELFEASEADTELLDKTLNWVPSSKLESTIPMIINFEKNRQNEKKLQYGNILITSCSGKVSLVNDVKTAALKINNSIKVIGGDISSEVISHYFVDDFWKMPKLMNISISEFIKECKSKKISVIIPTRDGELEYFARHKGAFKKEGISVMVSDIKSIQNCTDKLQFSKNNNLSIIPSFISIDNLKVERFVVKERFGAGSHSIAININYSDALLHARTLENPIFQPFIQGKELSVDAYITKQKLIKGIVIRERKIIINGESQVTQTVIDNDLEKKFNKIIQSLNLSGHIILQAIIDKDGEVHVIECNPRFGGASSLAIYCGLDSFYWFYLESIGIQLNEYPFYKPNKEITQVRHKKDLYK